MVLEGLKVGHCEDREKGTGVTVFIPDEPCACSCYIYGFASGTRQIDSLHPLHPVERVDAILFTGGSAFGLDCARGVMRFMKERGRGAEVRGIKVPIVPSAAIFDLFFIKPEPPDESMAYNACLNARSEIYQGSVGAGCGATVGKILTVKYGMKGGFGAAQVEGAGGVKISVFAVVNAFGDVIDPKTGDIIAGARSPEDGKKFLRTKDFIKKGGNVLSSFLENTTLLLIHINGKMNKLELRKICISASSSLTRVISPSPSNFDGDVCFALSTGEEKLDILSIIPYLPEAVEMAVMNAVKYADGMGVIPSFSDIKGKK